MPCSVLHAWVNWMGTNIVCRIPPIRFQACGLFLICMSTLLRRKSGCYKHVRWTLNHFWTLRASSRRNLTGVLPSLLTPVNENRLSVLQNKWIRNKNNESVNGVNVLKTETSEEMIRDRASENKNALSRSRRPFAKAEPETLRLCWPKLAFHMQHVTEL